MAPSVKIRQIVKEIGDLIDQPPQLSPGAARKLSAFCHELDHRVRNTEQELLFSERGIFVPCRV